jgi:hypothetical protein
VVIKQLKHTMVAAFHQLLALVKIKKYKLLFISARGSHDQGF